MMALESLAARRGCPIQYHSDCGTNFIAAAKVYRDPNGERPRWKLNPPGTPHTGGAWERLIGLTKRTLEGLAMERTPTPERLRWFLCRVELLINSRPLTDIPRTDEAGTALTPNELLLGSSSGRKDRTQKDPSGQEDLAEFLCQRNEDIAYFWKGGRLNTFTSLRPEASGGIRLRR